MPQGKRDGKNPKFRILCKKCNSYTHTLQKTLVVGTSMDDLNVTTVTTCIKCLNTAGNIDEEFEE
jgi:hypothetical protein